MSTYYFDRLESLHDLISRKATGPPVQLARKFNVSERTIYSYIDQLRSLGAEVGYCNTRRTYYYENKGVFNFRFKLE